MTEIENSIAKLMRLADAEQHGSHPAIGAQQDDPSHWSVLPEPLWQALDAAAYESALGPESVDRIARLYRRLGPPSRARHRLLRLLGASGSTEALETFAELIVSDPPTDATDAALAFVPLFQRPTSRLQRLFPRLLDALQHPAVAAIVLDLANHLWRQRRMARHPASGRVDDLARLLGALATRLARIEEQPREAADTPATLTAIVGESVALIVALCDAMGAIGDASVTGKLYQVLELAHRRVRTEAAAALARLGDETGTSTLAQLAADPATRLRALAYLEELGLQDRASEEDRAPEARAAGELAAWLAEPGQFGVPPQSIELVDACHQYWPGYDEPVDCWLLRFEYHLGGRSWSGIGIAGPVVHAMAVELADLPPADIYAMYAGWSAEHAEIGEMAASELTAAHLAAWQRARAEVARQGFERLELVKSGWFFGEEHWVATARHSGRPGVVVFDGSRVEWFAQGTGRRPPGPTEVYYLYKGRKLLRVFNRAT